MASCSSGCGAATPTSIFSASGRAERSRRGGHEMVVQHDVRRLEALQAADGQQTRIAGAGADEIDDGHSQSFSR